MRRHNKPYQWLVKEGEGHGFFNVDNRVAQHEASLQFLKRHIGPQAESR
ncbi:MAG: hypothetical protein ACXIUM_10810 [Wenzhouxiangella sp.]